MLLKSDSVSDSGAYTHGAGEGEGKDCKLRAGTAVWRSEAGVYASSNDQRTFVPDTPKHILVSLMVL